MIEKEFEASPYHQHQVTTPEILPISKKAKMDRFYEEFSNNKRRGRGANRLLVPPKYHSDVIDDRQ
jgi:hypothetical protein